MAHNLNPKELLENLLMAKVESSQVVVVVTLIAIITEVPPLITNQEAMVTHTAAASIQMKDIHLKEAIAEMNTHKVVVANMAVAHKEWALAKTRVEDLCKAHNLNKNHNNYPRIYMLPNKGHMHIDLKLLNKLDQKAV